MKFDLHTQRYVDWKVYSVIKLIFISFKILFLVTPYLVSNWIAEILSLSLNTVKSYCKRHKLGGRRERTAENILLCKQCGEGVPQTPHRKAKIFCSDKCRMAWWNAHPKDVQRKSEQIFVCPVCGGSFSAYASAKQKFCSRKCYGISKGTVIHER